MATVLAVKTGILEPVESKNTSKKNRIKVSNANATFRAKVVNIMRAEGASEQFIEAELTDNAIKEAMRNHFSAESLAWALLQ